MSDMTIVQTAPKSNPPVVPDGSEGRWLLTIGEIAQECAKHGLDIDKDGCRRMLQSGSLPGVKFTERGPWRSHTSLLARHFANLLASAL